MPKIHIKAILKECYRSKDVDACTSIVLFYVPEGNMNEIKKILKDFCGVPFTAEIVEEYADKILSAKIKQEEPKSKRFKYKEAED